MCERLAKFLRVDLALQIGDALERVAARGLPDADLRRLKAFQFKCLLVSFFQFGDPERRRIGCPGVRGRHALLDIEAGDFIGDAGGDNGGFGGEIDRDQMRSQFLHHLQVTLQITHARIAPFQLRILLHRRQHMFKMSLRTQHGDMRIDGALVGATRDVADFTVGVHQESFGRVARQ